MKNARVSAKFIDPSEDCTAGDCSVLPAASPARRLMRQANSQTPLNNKQVAWSLVHGAGGLRARERSGVRNVIHKKVQMAIYIGFGFLYNRGRIRMVLHITSFRGDG